MKPSELREQTPAELEQRLREAKESLFNLRMQASTGQLENVRRIREVRRDIARIRTTQRAKAQEAAGS